MSAPLNVALVGYGFVGTVFHAPLIAATDGLTLHSIVSSRPEAVHADWPGVRVAADLTSVLADPAVDLVVIATPNTLHAPQAHAALDAGKHVVVDKPFTVSLAEAVAVLAHGERVDRVVSVFQNRRWDSDFLTLRALIADGAVGEVTQFDSHFDRFRPEVRDRWRERPGPGTGLWFDLGPHLLDQATQLFGAPLAITADIAIQRDGSRTDDWFHVVLRHARLRVILHASAMIAAGEPRFAVHGTQGSIVTQGLDSQEDALKAGRTPGDLGWGAPLSPVLVTSASADGATHTRAVPSEPGDYRRFYAAVRDAIRGTAANPVSAADASLVMHLLELGRESSDERREVMLPA